MPVFTNMTVYMAFNCRGYHRNCSSSWPICGCQDDDVGPMVMVICSDVDMDNDHVISDQSL